jgi:hypothetical protein
MHIAAKVATDGLLLISLIAFSAGVVLLASPARFLVRLSRGSGNSRPRLFGGFLIALAVFLWAVHIHQENPSSVSSSRIMGLFSLLPLASILVVAIIVALTFIRHPDDAEQRLYRIGLSSINLRPVGSSVRRRVEHRIAGLAILLGIIGLAFYIFMRSV